MTKRLTLLTFLAAALAAAPASAAGPVPLLATPNDVDAAVAVAGSDVIVARSGPLGTLRVDALPTAGGPARSLLRTAPRGEDWSTFTTAVAASPQRVAVVAVFASPSVVFTSRLYAGPPNGPLALVASVREDSGGWRPTGVAVDGDRVLVLESDGEDTRLRLLVPGVAPRIVPPEGFLNGQFAFAGQRLAYQSNERLFVADLATGARLLSARSEDFVNLDVAADGTIVADGDDIGVFTIMPSGLRQGVPDGEFLGNPRFAGSAIAAIEETRAGHSRPVVLAPDAIHPRPIGLPSSSIDVIDADARGVAWLANGCVLYATLDAVAPAEPPAGPCGHAEVDVENASLTIRGRRLRMVAECIAATAAGCDGTIRILGPGIIGRGAFHVEAGRTKHFNARFTRRSVRRIRREVRRSDSIFLELKTRLIDGGPPSLFDEVFIDKVRSAP